jgi:N-carbamoyl-L-amino-acid hydrolase
VDAARLRRRIERLSEFGRPSGGTFADGVTRVAFTAPFVEASKWLAAEMRALGLAVRIDPAGNIFGRYAGSDPAAKPVLSGSHIDSVPNGGNFDGPLGTLAALEAIASLKDRGVKPRRSVEAVAWVSEEGVAFNDGLLGSTAATSGLSAAALSQTWQGMTLAEALRRIEGDPTRVERPWIAPGDYSAYVELHIEQGRRMLRDNVQIGIVEGIVAIVRYPIAVIGEANHAGTTMMADRRDALVAASDLVLAVNRIAQGMRGNRVATVGMLTVKPGAANVIPGEVNLTVEMRDMSSAVLERMAAQLRAECDRIAHERKVEIRWSPTPLRDGQPCDPGIMVRLESAAAKRGLRAGRMPSGAGHDASNMAKICPMGMIFVPSQAGVSHSPRELTAWEDCANGANVLLDVLLDLAS